MTYLLLIYSALLIFLTYRSPAISVVILAAILPSYGIRFSIFSIPITLLELSIWVVFIGWFIKQYREHGLPRLNLREALSQSNPFHHYLWPIILFVLTATIAVIMSPNIEAALGIWKAYFVEPLMVFVLMVVILRGQKERWWILISLGVTVAALSIVAWYQHFTGNLLPAPWLTTRPLRVTSLYSYPNALGLFIGPILAMYITWLMNDLITPKLTAYGLRLTAISFKVLVIILGLGAIIFSVTKGAWVGVAAGVFVGALFVFKNVWQRVIAASLIVVALLFILPATRESFISYITLNSPSGKVRQSVWRETAAFLYDHPISGAGLAGYQTALEPYHEWWNKNLSPYKLEIFLYPHNVFLNFWAELGMAGLIAFLWLLGVFALLVWRARNNQFAIIALAGMVALLTHGLVDAPYFKNDLAVLFWIIMALPLL